MTERNLRFMYRSSLSLMAVLSCIALLSTNGCEHDPHSQQTHSDVTSQAANHGHEHSDKADAIVRTGEPIPDQAEASELPQELAQDVGNSPDTECVCHEARINNTWCASCNRGFVAGLTIESEKLFEALDAHGHVIDSSGITCESCLKALPEDGFCAAHRWGYVDGKMYASDMTWSLARGTIDEPDQLKCSQCRADSEHRGWCESCGVGHVGAVRFASREDYDRAARQQDRLGLALITLKRCEECSIRTFFGGVCRLCGTDSLTLPGHRLSEDSTMTEN